MKQFDFVETHTMKTKNGGEYERHFWKSKSNGAIATYMEMSLTRNPKEIGSMQALLDDTIVGYSFGKGWKEGQDPVYVFTMDDKSKMTYTHSELLASLSDLTKDDREVAERLVVLAPFRMGENMHRLANTLADKSSTKGRRLR
ncbi:MAG: hypothetical protein ACTSWQ_07295 [Candidatus Thorarchaeota archaeon]